jgi:glycosyltransferase involved in cell wall biosynthesis
VGSLARFKYTRSMTTTPVSLIITTYKRPLLLKRALESVAHQTLQPAQILVVDDFSQDNTSEVVAAFQDRLPVEFHAMPENIGRHTFTKSVGVTLSKQPFIAYLDDDNEWMPEHLALAMATLHESQTQLVYTEMEYIMDFHDPSFSSELPDGKRACRAWDPEVMIQGKENWVDSSCIVHTREAAELLKAKTGYYWNKDRLRFGDWDFMVRWAQAELSAQWIPQCTVRYYWHGENLQLTKTEPEK